MKNSKLFAAMSAAVVALSGASFTVCADNESEIVREVKFTGKVFTAVTDNEDSVVTDGEIYFYSTDAETTVSETISDGDYAVCVPEGKYKVTIAAEGYVTRVVNGVEVSETTPSEDFFVLHPADVNGDGVVDIEDAVLVLGQINGNKALDAVFPEYGDYANKVADVNGDKSVDIEDAVAAIGHINGVKALY